MKRHELENELKKQVAAETPDVLDAILERCGEQPESICRTEDKAPKQAKRMWRPVLATAAAVAVIVAGSLGLHSYTVAHAVDTVVSLDVNPGVEIMANSAEKVLSISALDEEAGAALEGSALEGKTLEDAADEIVLILTEEGYITQEANSVLVTVNNADSAKAEDIEGRLIERIVAVLDSKGVEGSVLGQTVSGGRVEASTSTDISAGKAALVEKLAALSPELDAEELKNMPVSDLAVLAEVYAGEDGLKGVVRVGKASEDSYIGAEGAVNATGAELGINALDIVKAQTSVGVDEGKLVYKVDIETDVGHVFSIVDAVTGKILDAVADASGYTGNSGGSEAAGSESGEEYTQPPAVETPAVEETPYVSEGMEDAIEGEIKSGVEQILDKIGDTIKGLLP